MLYLKPAEESAGTQNTSAESLNAGASARIQNTEESAKALNTEKQERAQETWGAQAAQSAQTARKILETSRAQKRIQNDERKLGYAGIAAVLAAVSLLIFVILPAKEKQQSQNTPQSETYIVQAADAQPKTSETETPNADTQDEPQADILLTKPYTLYDVGKAPEGGQEIERPDESFWHPCSWFPESVELAKIQYETYDAEGNHIARDSYIPRWYDSSKDRGVLVKLGKEYADFDGYGRRLQEYWTYDEEGQAVSYRAYKQYGADLEPQLYEEKNLGKQIDGTNQAYGDAVTSNDSKEVPEEVLAALKDADKKCTWGEEQRRAYITETDYYGAEHAFIYDYDTQGRKTRGYYIQDGEARLIYEAHFDEEGRVVEIDDNTPCLIKERLEDKYRENFYDEELTQPLRPRQSENRYQFYFYAEDAENRNPDAPAYMLNIDSWNGTGGLYVYQYDEAGRLSVTYFYYIEDAYLGEFTLDTPAGGCLYFSDSHEEYYTYEKTGFKWLHDRYFVTEIAMDHAAGKLAWTFSFDKGNPTLRKEGDAVVDWTKKYDINRIPGD